MKEKYMIKEYHKIAQTERLLTQKTKSLIISTLKEKGRISFRPEGFQNEEDFEELSNEDYPIVTQLCGKHDSPDIRITDVYLGADGAVYADGIDNETEEWRKGFYIIEDQFRYILHFIAVVLEWDGELPETNPDKDSCNDKITATILFGEEAVKEYDETGNIPTEGWFLDNGGVVDQVEFDSKAEYDSYVKGLNDADGWSDWKIIGKETFVTK